jgi:alcohol dehydrogenase (cytochrome c)/quinohemoprotein ethanol dehydrogenase
MQASKDGFFYVLDRESGKLLSASPFVHTNWASRVDPATGRPVENKENLYSDT